MGGPTLAQSMRMLGTVLAIVGGISAGIFTLESRYATAEELDRVASDTVETIQQLRCDIIIQRLNELRAKERLDELSEYDRVRRDQLRSQWQRTCGNHENSIPQPGSMQ